MRRAALLALALALALAACAHDPAPVTGIPVKVALPSVPGDIQRCFKAALTDPPDRELTVEEIEQFWQTDRIRAVAMRQCGTRFLAWYAGLRKSWH